MLEKVILADSDDDLYEGYNEFHPALDTRVFLSPTLMLTCLI